MSKDNIRTAVLTQMTVATHSAMMASVHETAKNDCESRSGVESRYRLMTVRAVVFDIGGVLEVVPGGGDPTRAFPRMLAAWESRLHLQSGELERKIDDLGQQFAAQGKDGGLGTCSEEEWWVGLQDITGMNQADLADFIQDFWDVYLGNQNHELTAYLTGLRPRFQTALLSNSFVGARQREQERYHFAEMTDLIVYSHEEGIAKPNPGIFVLTCRRLGVQPEEVVFLDDAPRNLAAARELGMRAVQFTDTAQAIADVHACLNER
jgi:putative hydrolase of the HAD superfamily